MFAIGNEEIAKCRPLGKTVKCQVCGKRHKVEYGKQKLDDGTYEPSNILAFYRCGDKTYLCGIDGACII